jgi:hypothetical protein
VELAPEVDEPVLDGRSREAHAESSGKSVRRAGELGVGFRMLAFVEDDRVPGIERKLRSSRRRAGWSR